MKEGLRRLYSGEYNFQDQEVQPDGSVVVTLSKEGEGKVFRFRVMNLFQENEEVLEHEVLDTKPPKFLTDRMKQARKEMEQRRGK